MLTVFLTVTGEPPKGGTLAPRKAVAMQPPVGVPANVPPSTRAEVTRPEGANVTLTDAEPLGPSPLHPAAGSPAGYVADRIRRRNICSVLCWVTWFKRLTANGSPDRLAAARTGIRSARTKSSSATLLGSATAAAGTPPGTAAPATR